MNVDFPKLEKEVLKSWKENRTFEKSVEKRKKAPRFVFYEGPPTANAGPAMHHVLGRAFKDIMGRYKTMRGFLVERKAGWDTHGLPVEIQIEKKLGLRSKKEIEEYGIAKFNKECRDSVFKFKKEWEDLTERIGYWLDLKNPYITYEANYIESLWWIIKEFSKKKLLYKDYKVVPYCTRCGTPLSSHELAQGYQTVNEPSVYVKFLITTSKFKDAYFLAWTTTPWTLPGNVALAVNSDIEYAIVKKDGNKYILSKERVKDVLLDEYEIVKTVKGKELIGIKYEPIFSFVEPENGKKVWEVVPADFVSTDGGTGIVHTAVAYGVDDFELGKKENLAMLHLVDKAGKFIKEVKPWSGMFVKAADPLIIKELERNKALLKQELYEHEYPFCWRCKSPLLYYAMESWFVRMSEKRKEMVKENETINWVPSYIKKGRFGGWISEAKDWAFSRDRYWGTPLPIWECDECSHYEVIGSIEDLVSQTSSKNTYYVMRHGHSERQELDIVSSWPEKKKLSLTAKGKKEVQKTALELQKKNIDIILTSDLLRTQETANIVGKELGLTPKDEKALREISGGDLNGKHVKEAAEYWRRKGETKMEHYLRRFKESSPKGESYTDVRKRMYELLKKLENKHEGKTILLVSHDRAISILKGAVAGMSNEETILDWQKKSLKTAGYANLKFSQLPYDDKGNLDLHRPYIDEVRFDCPKCEKGKTKRVKEVADVWFDSGAMPLAQHHYPFENKDLVDKGEWYPAEYISEAIDQTRGWFYTLLAVSTALGRKAPYKNVISLGHLLDTKGEKMSKSKGNIVNPWEVIDVYGSDAIRWYFFTQNHPGDSKLFSTKDVDQVVKKFMLTLWNSYVFYDTYKGKTKNKKSKNVLDRWIVSRLNDVIESVTKKLDEYDVTGAARTLEQFVIEDVSLWYIRRSRSRFQNPDTQIELAEAVSTLGHVLKEISILSSPFIPFLSDWMYGKISNTKESVHLEDWSKAEKKERDEKLEKDMQVVRDIVAQGLRLRAEAGIKVRQPLLSIEVKEKISSELQKVIREELNVKKVVVSSKKIVLDKTITPALKREGQLRDILRRIQQMRKQAGYAPSDIVRLRYQGEKAIEAIISAHKSDIKKAVGIKEVLVKDKPKQVFDVEQEFEVGGQSLWLGIRKI